jgi:antagonist of KipI
MLPWFLSQHELHKIYQPANSIHCVPGAEHELLTAAAATNLEQQHFVISNQSDRMGFRLASEPLSLYQAVELVSSAVDMGTVQLLPSGDCIVLMADHQTTGGYPRIAAVIKADLPKLAQAKPGDSINFNMVSLKEAEDRLIALQQIMQKIKASCHLNLKRYV